MVAVLGGEVDQALDRAAGLGLATRLEVLADGDERQDGARALEVEVVHRRLRGAVDVAGRQLLGHGEHRGDRPGDARPAPMAMRASSHGGGAVEERLGAADEVGAVGVHDGRQQEQLGQGERHGVVVVSEGVGQGPSEHVAHTDVEQGDQEREGDREAAPHGAGALLEFLLGGEILAATAPPRRRVLWRLRGPGASRSSPRGPPRRRSGLGVQQVLVVVDRHRARQQVDGDLPRAIESADGAVDVRLARGARHAADVEGAMGHTAPSV